MMLDESPHYARCSFRPQRQLAASAVFKGIHFFLDDVGRFAEGPLKKVEGFKGRRADLLVAVAMKESACGGFERLKLGGIGRQDIFGPTDRLVFRHGEII